MARKSLQVAETILQQLGGRRFIAMTGAKNFVGDARTLTFSIPLSQGINKVRIVLNYDDTYSMKFYYIRRADVKLLTTYSHIYWDQLQELFTTATGLYTSLTNPYTHERVVSPRTVRRQGLTKYRSIKTRGGDVVRLAYPPGRRRKGAGRVQSILHKNPKRKTIQVRALKTPTKKELTELINLWHLSRMESNNRHERMIWTSSWFAKEHPDFSPTGAYKILDRQLAGYYINPCEMENPRRRARARAARRNPGRVKIYDRVIEVVAQKGPGHKCDAKCKRAGHRYIHRFKTKNALYGEPDGSITIH